MFCYILYNFLRCGRLGAISDQVDLYPRQLDKSTTNFNCFRMASRSPEKSTTNADSRTTCYTSSMSRCQEVARAELFRNRFRQLVCRSCRSCQELSNEYLVLVFTCKNWRRYSREWASQRLPKFSQQLGKKLEYT